MADPISGGRQRAPADEARLRRLVADHFDFIWRTLRRLGVTEISVQDAAQKVFFVASRKIGPIPLEGERGFLFAIALRVAADERRDRRRHPDAPQQGDLPDIRDEMPLPDELVDRHKARTVLEGIISELPLDLGAVFVLFEIEEMSLTQIAEMLCLPRGTIASRLRRSRELFDAAVGRYRARSLRGGAP